MPTPSPTISIAAGCPASTFARRASSRRSTSGRDDSAAASRSTSRSPRRSSRSSPDWPWWRARADWGDAHSAGGGRRTSSSTGSCRSTSCAGRTRYAARSSAESRWRHWSDSGSRRGRAGARAGRAGWPTAERLVREQSREEVLYGAPEGVGALLDVAFLQIAPESLGLRLGRLAGVLELLAGELCALGDRLADTLGRLLHAVAKLALPDLLRARLDLARRRLHLGLVGSAGGQRPGDDGAHGQRTDYSPHSRTS